METILSAREVAELKGCSPRWIRHLATTEQLKGQQRVNADGSPEWVFPISRLDDDLQQKYFDKLKASFPAVQLSRPALYRDGEVL